MLEHNCYHHQYYSAKDFITTQKIHEEKSNKYKNSSKNSIPRYEQFLTRVSELVSNIIQMICYY